MMTNYTKMCSRVTRAWRNRCPHATHGGARYIYGDATFWI